MSVNGVIGIFLSDDFLSVNKNSKKNGKKLKHIIISFINEFYSDGKNLFMKINQKKIMIDNLDEIEKKLLKF